MQFKFITIWLLCLMAATGSTFAQTISGNVQEPSKVAVEFATVALYKLPDSVLIKGVVADENGDFLLTEIKMGDYYLVAVNVGFKKSISKSIRLSQEMPSAKMNLVLESEVLETDAVLIEVQRQLVKQEAGITTVDIENSPMNAGLSTAEALKRVPGVTVDKDGKVKLKGKDGVMVMLDDKPLYMDAAQVAALLKSLPADQVKSIEVLTSPSAKYDAAGNAGIINIKLKKGTYEGMNGTANASVGYGLNPKSATGFNLSYRKKKLSLNGGYQYNYKKAMQESFLYRNYVSDGDSSYKTNSENIQVKQSHNVLFGGNYDFNPKNSFNWTANGMYSDANWKGGNNAHIQAPSGATVSTFRTNDFIEELHTNFNTSAGYKHVFDTSGTELSGNVNYNTFEANSGQAFNTTYFNPLGEQQGNIYQYQSTIPINVDQGSAKVDFVKQLSAKTKWESGLKYNQVRSESNVSSSFIKENNFVYTEQVKAAYTMLGTSAGKWKLNAGLRVENTSNVGVQKSIDSTFKRNYTNLFPNANVTFLKSEKTSFSLLYSRRIERPDYESLNPFSYYSDPFSKYSGNPYLVPQFTHHTEFVVSKWHGAFLTTFDYSYSTQPFAEALIFEKNSLATTYTSTNLQSRENVGISFSLNMPVTKWWTMSNYLHLYNNKLVGDVGYGLQTASRFAWSANATHSFKLPHGFSGELSGNYSSPHYWGLMFYRQVWQVSAGLQKKFWKDKLTVKAAITDIFWTQFYTGKGTFGNTQTSDQYKWENRVAMLTLTYHFGRKAMADEPKSMMNSGGGMRR